MILKALEKNNKLHVAFDKVKQFPMSSDVSTPYSVRKSPSVPIGPSSTQ